MEVHGNEKVGIIGLHGMGGVGKSTLMKELNNKLCNDTHNFDHLFWIVMSSTPNISKIQNDIGRILGFDSDEWKEKYLHEKSADIYNILRKKKYVLFLDDVWQRLDFIGLGVPLPDVTNKSKIVLSTRTGGVCHEMGADRIFQVSGLNDKDAWNLFCKKVGENIINADPQIQELAKVVAKKCDGLPIALIVIGRAMAWKTTPRAWNSAINQLKKYSADFTGMGDQVLPLLKFSYDNIPHDAIKCCFLYCSLYPEDHLIDKKDIIDKWICEGFLDSFIDLHEARNQGYDYIDTLVNASLLEETCPDVIKMHDIIREMAIWIACECGEIKNKFFVRAGVGLTKTPNVLEFEGSERMSLMENRIDELMGKLNCPNLLTLFLNGATKLNYIDSAFFQSMPNLRVLDLSANGSLLEIPVEVRNSVNLQYLNLGGTRISRFPFYLRNLINLKWLSFRSTNIANRLPKGLLSSFKKLQVLHLPVSRDILPITFFEEIKSLTQLNDLTIGITTDVDLWRFSSSHKLASITTELRLSYMTTSRNLDFLFSQKMVNLTALRLEFWRHLEYVISREIHGISNIINFNNFKTLYILGCYKLKDITVLTFAPNLESICIKDCEGMTELCGEWKWEQEVGRPTIFSKLNYLRLANLKELERIYPNALPLFPCLKEAMIHNCPKLKKLPFNSSSCNSGSGVTIEGTEEWWKELEWEDEATRIAFLHSFKMWDC